MRTSSQTWVPLITFSAAAILCAVAGPGHLLHAVRQAMSATSGNCHQGKFIPGAHRELTYVDGGAPSTAPPGPHANPDNQPGVGALIKKTKEVDSRHQDGSFRGFALSVGPPTGPATSQIDTGNIVEKQLLLVGAPTGEDDCCHDFGAAATIPIKLGWTIDTSRPLAVSQGTVSINTLAAPQDVMIEIDWVDCEGQAHFRRRKAVVAMEAVVKLDASGAVVLDSATGSIEERFGSDGQPEGPVPGKIVKIAGRGSKGSKNYLLHESHHDEFKGSEQNKPGASIEITGKATVKATAAPGTKGAVGEIHVKVASHELVDTDEGIVVK